VQLVRHGSGRVCGTILWESKRTATWQRGWVATLKEDQRRGSHPQGVIVFDALPYPDQPVTRIDAVWVTNLDTASDLALVLRETVMQVASTRGAPAPHDDLKGRVYDYVGGPQFSDRVRGIVETMQSMRTSRPGSQPPSPGSICSSSPSPATSTRAPRPMSKPGPIGCTPVPGLDG
jgi:hypothetical protein